MCQDLFSGFWLLAIVSRLRALGEKPIASSQRPTAYCVALPRFRPRTIIRCEDFFLLRVFTPSFLPHGLTTLRPPRVRPPCGWSTGFMTSPRTLGRRPFQRVLPALPHESSSCSSLPITPIVARQRP